MRLRQSRTMSNRVPPLRRKMVARDPDEEHRASTPLELLFDLCFVAAVGQASVQLHHGLTEGHFGSYLIGYGMVFFAIWWAWMNFTWFASAYDTDDTPYRLLTMLQMGGVLVLAAGVPQAFDHYNFTTVTIGYLIMRIGLIGQWLRAAAEHPEGRGTTLRYAGGLAVVQLGWLLRLLLPAGWAEAGFVVLVVAELAVPAFAERGRHTRWHPEHIAERYGLFTIIVLGEVVLGSVAAVQEDVGDGGWSPQLGMISLGGLLMIFAMWWTYFKHSAVQGLRQDQLRTALSWGYGHILVFASAAAVGAGLEVAIDVDAHAAHIGEVAAGLSLAVPLALFVLTTAALHIGVAGAGRLVIVITLAGAVLLLGTALLAEALTIPVTALALGVIMGLILLAGLVEQHRATS